MVATGILPVGAPRLEGRCQPAGRRHPSPRGRCQGAGARVSIARVDRVRLEQALKNLIVNAISYGPRGAEVEVVAHLESSDEGEAPTAGSILSIDVLDRGPGVSSELGTDLFEPFRRGPDAVGTGSGLGLATAAAAIRAHHGTLGFEPRIGGGTRFWVRLPA
jgi:signal transduction histidine kinase